MNMHKIFSKVILACIVTALASGCDTFSRQQQGQKINEMWEASNNTFKVRVTAYAEENGGFVAGAYYVFESAPVGSDNWHKIMTVRHDDPVPIPREQVRFVNDQIGYVYMMYQYAITTDGGATWVTWNITENLPNWQRNRAAIKEVQIAPDGKGTMTLTPFTNQTEVTELHTRDYGRHWSVE
jgi:hypothetical protein